MPSPSHSSASNLTIKYIIYNRGNTFTQMVHTLYSFVGYEQWLQCVQEHDTGSSIMPIRSNRPFTHLFLWYADSLYPHPHLCGSEPFISFKVPTKTSWC
jgi:hypothetical protein